jgi:hypothetical protein
MFLDQIVISHESNELERNQHYNYKYKAISLLHELSTVGDEKKKILEGANLKIVSGKKYRVFLNLLSFYGKLSQKYFPADFCNGFLRVQITFAKLAEAVILNSANTSVENLQITNPRLYIQTTKINNMSSNGQIVDILSAIRKLPSKIYSSAYDCQVRSYQSNSLSGQQITYDFSAAKYSSLRDVIFFFVPQASIAAKAKFQQDYVTAVLSSYQVIINNELFPSTKIDVDSEHAQVYSNILQCSGVMSDIFNSTGIRHGNFTREYVRTETVASHSTGSGECLYGISLEAFTSTSKMDNVIMSGVDTRNRGIHLQLEFNEDLEDTLYRMYVIFHYNMNVEINEEGVCSRYI